MSRDSLHRVIAGTDDGVPKIVAGTWEAILLRLRLAPTGAWNDTADLEGDVAYFVDASPALAAELIEAGIAAGLIESRTDQDRDQVRITPDPRAREGHHSRRRAT